ncbi:hypothetical protein [Marivirga sp.]|uniref:hypothetical protein n=1 Tax=Marivirga sp. TaxID=2018662 RepID=UPI003DA78C9B
MLKLFKALYVLYSHKNRLKLANTSTEIVELMPRRFLFTGILLLLISGCHTLDPIEVEPEIEKYKIANSDPTVIDLMEENVYSNSNQRLNKIKFREDSIYVLKTGEMTTYSIPIQTKIVGASENLILELEDERLVKAAIYSLQPKQVWYDEHYEGKDTDFTTIEGNLIVTDLFSGKETIFSNSPSGKSSRKLTQDCNFFISSAEESPNWYIWLDLESCSSGGGSSSGGSDSGDPYNGSPDANNPDPGSGSGGGGNSSGSVPISGDEDSMNDVPCHIGFVRNSSGECVRDCGEGYISGATGCILDWDNYIDQLIKEFLKEMDCDKLQNTHGYLTKSMWDFYDKYKGWCREDIIYEKGDLSITGLGSQPAGPLADFRYIEDPLNSKLIIDMRHLLIIGKYGRAVGESVEFVQYLSNNESGFDDQDYYSNELGYKFYEIYGDAIDHSSDNIVDFLVTFLNDPAKRNEVSSPNKCK